MKVQKTQAWFDKVTDPEKHIREVMIDLHKLIVDDWNEVANLKQYLKANTNTIHYLIDRVLACKSETVLCPSTGEMLNPSNSSVWLNNGYSVDDKLNDWEVYYDKRKIQWRKND
jgi:hypothetical protein